MGRGAETIKAQCLAATGRHQRAPADHPSAQKGCQVHVIPLFAKRKGIAGVCDGMARKAAVARIACEQGAVAKILPSHRAIGTDAAAVAEPGYADALAQPKM